MSAGGGRLSAFWDQRALLGDRAGTDDGIAAALERRAMRRWVPPGARVLEAGCGVGTLARQLVRQGADVTAFDDSLAMIGVARRLGGGTFFTGDLRNPFTWPVAARELVDLVITQRALINLANWHEQLAAIGALSARLRRGGLYLMGENVQEGLEGLNVLRARWDLPAVVPPSHNRYLWHVELIRDVPRETDLRCLDIGYPCSTYAVLSRLVNAKLAQRRGRSPRYDAWPNRLARYLPAIGRLGQQRLYVWERQ